MRLEKKFEERHSDLNARLNAVEKLAEENWVQWKAVKLKAPSLGGVSLCLARKSLTMAKTKADKALYGTASGDLAVAEEVIATFEAYPFNKQDEPSGESKFWGLSYDLAKDETISEEAKERFIRFLRDVAFYQLKFLGQYLEVFHPLGVHFVMHNDGKLFSPGETQGRLEELLKTDTNAALLLMGDIKNLFDSSFQEFVSAAMIKLGKIDEPVITIRREIGDEHLERLEKFIKENPRPDFFKVKG